MKTCPSGRLDESGTRSRPKSAPPMKVGCGAGKELFTWVWFVRVLHGCAMKPGFTIMLFKLDACVGEVRDLLALQLQGGEGRMPLRRRETGLVFIFDLQRSSM